MLKEYQKAAEEGIQKTREAYNDLSMAYKSTFNGESGQRVLENLMTTFNAEASYLPGGNLQDTCYYEGQKAVIAHIYTLLNYKHKS